MTRALALLLAAQASAQVTALSGSFILPFEDEAINYPTPALDNPVARLQRKIDSGEVQLEFKSPNGYLLSILKNLNFPVSSQMLVFSKTSFQLNRINPVTPRAIFFNDEVYAGWVKFGEVMEVSVADPVKGGVFYTIDQIPSPRPRFVRHDECLQCHAAPRTLGVPGHIVRSVYSDSEGFPQTQTTTFNTDHSSPFAERFGGWFVTGAHGRMRHMGNAFIADKNNPDVLDKERSANLRSLKTLADLADYPSPYGDLVAHMVLAHQATGHNLITRVAFETRVALSQQEGINRALGRPPDEWSDSTRRRIYNTTEIMLRYFLFSGEAKLEDPVRGASSFTAEFPRQGPRDAQGRSLRDFDLQTRLFKYPLSFLIYTDSFDRLPPPALRYFYRRLRAVLSGEARDKEFAHLSPQDRQAIARILDETKPYWKSF